PLESVRTASVVRPFWNVPLAPLSGATNWTVTPPTGLSNLSVTRAARGLAKVVVTGVLCGVPAVSTTFAGARARLVRLKSADPLASVAVTVTVKEPAVVCGVREGVAPPSGPVETVSGFGPLPPNVPPAPLPGAVKMTGSPGGAGPPSAFLTRTLSGWPKSAPTVVVWKEPLTTVIVPTNV